MILIEHDNPAGVSLRQMKCNRCAHHSRANDDDISGFGKR
jgi:AICAR transformylase/IMP cyclohydrolase PurH